MFLKCYGFSEINKRSEWYTIFVYFWIPFLFGVLGFHTTARYLTYFGTIRSNLILLIYFFLYFFSRTFVYSFKVIFLYEFLSFFYVIIYLIITLALLLSALVIISSFSLSVFLSFNTFMFRITLSLSFPHIILFALCHICSGKREFKSKFWLKIVIVNIKRN